MGLPASRVDEMLELVVADPGRGEAPDAQLLARHEAAARHRPRAARGPLGADPRRAGQRARPRRHPLDARAAQGLRRPRRHRAALQPPAQRGGADRRRDDPHRPAAGSSPRATRSRCSPMGTDVTHAGDRRSTTQASHRAPRARRASTATAAGEGRLRVDVRAPWRSGRAAAETRDRAHRPALRGTAGLEDLFLELTTDAQREPTRFDAPQGAHRHDRRTATATPPPRRSTSRPPRRSRSAGWSGSSSARSLDTRAGVWLLITIGPDHLRSS